MEINLIGTIFGSSGYSNHTKGLFNAVYKLNKDIKLDSTLPPDWEILANNEERLAIKKDFYKKGVSVAITVPNNLDTLFTIEKETYAFCVWEGNKVPKTFEKRLKKLKGILVPSNHVKEAIENTFPDLKVPIYLIPHGVDFFIFNIENKPKEDRPFTFIANKGWVNNKDRGGIQFLIQAFIKEFSPEDNVRLVIKINTSYCPNGWNLGNLMAELGVSQEYQKNIIICAENLELTKIADMYRSGDVFVSPSMGEAFSLPCAEAMACGLPVITTGFGGQTDFVTKDNGWLIDYELWENDWDFAYEGISWALPRLDHLRKLLRYSFEHQEEVKEKSKKAVEDIKSYSWENSAKKLLKVLKDTNI